MTSFATFLFCFMSMFAPEHNVPLAVFHLHEVDERIALDVNIDAASVAMECGVAVEALSIMDLSRYLDSKTSWAFNKEIRPLTIIDFSILDDHIQIHAFFEEEICQVNEIEIQNSCLIANRNHSNIIQFDIAGKSSDYRMHSGRTTIKVSF